MVPMVLWGEAPYPYRPCRPLKLGIDLAALAQGAHGGGVTALRRGKGGDEVDVEWIWLE